MAGSRLLISGSLVRVQHPEPLESPVKPSFAGLSLSFRRSGYVSRHHNPPQQEAEGYRSQPVRSRSSSMSRAA